MAKLRSVGAIVGIGALILGLVGCGTITSGTVSNLTGGTANSSTLSAASLPCCFVTIEATVTQMLPEDTRGLPHQKFVVEETSPDSGTLLEVDNDEHYGTRVPGLQVGENLEIRGVVWHDPNGKSGIHWTHHDNVQNDAGYIKTPDGSVYQ